MRLLSAGVRLGSYEIIELLGRGGMGEVYKAFDAKLWRHAAVKILSDAGAGENADERVQRFLREARTASALDHPNIVTIYDAASVAIAPGETMHYIAMELVDGSTLRAKLTGAPIEELLPIFIQIADALAKAHEAGVVHRDLKPENILVKPDGMAKIVDFGLAKSFKSPVVGEQFKTQIGVLVGTLAYMSPEQVHGDPVDGRSDMFAFGSMLFEALTGTLPFIADSEFETLRRIANDTPRWLSRSTDALQQVAERCLAKRPDDRYPTMADVAVALRATRAEVPRAVLARRSEPAAELSAAAREVVSVAAVIGMTVSVRELWDLFDDHDALDDSLDELVGHGILVEEDRRRGTFRFASASEREAFYGRIPRRRRKEIHAACAAHGERILGARLATIELLRHFQSSGASAKVVVYGLPLLRDLVERVRTKDAIDVADLVADAAGDDWSVVLEATELLARAYSQVGDYDRALERLDAMRPVIETSPEALTRLARTAAQVAWEARRIDVAERWIQRGLSGSDNSGDAAPVREILALATTINVMKGDAAAADEYALRLSREEERPPARADLRGGRIVVPSMRSLHEVDPSRSDQDWHGEIMGSIFETLTRVAADGRIVPWLASFEANADSTAFRFCLREGLRFHDGRAVKSGDVAFSYARLLRQPANASRWALAPIRGARAVADGSAEVLEGFICHTDREFTVELSGPVAVFPAIASYIAAGIVPTRTGVLSGTWRETCVGTGPYRVARFEPGRRLELEANPYYWRDGLPRTGRLAFVMGLSSSEIVERFRSRELTLARYLSDDDFWTLRRDAELHAQYSESPRLSTYFLVANRHKGPFADPALRKQAFGIDVEAVLHASHSPSIRRAYTLSPPGLIGHVRSLAHKPQPSQTAVWGKIPVTLGVLSGVALDHPAVVERLVQALAGRGFVVETVPSDYATRTPEMLAAFDLFAGRWYADYPDADSFNDSLLHTQHGIYGAFCGDPKLDEIIEQARTETDARVRRDDYAEIEELLQRDSVLLPLFHENVYCFAQAEVGGFEVNFSRPSVSYEQLWL